LPPGVAMLVSNEIERPITVNIRPRKSRHGGVSTQIVAREKAVAQRKTSGPETRPAASARKSGSEEKSGKRAAQEGLRSPKSLMCREIVDQTKTFSTTTIARRMACS